MLGTFIRVLVKRPLNSIYSRSVHLANQVVDLFLPVASITTLHEMLEFAAVETAIGVAELEGPEKVVGLLDCSYVSRCPFSYLERN